MIELAKQALDVGLYTNHRDESLEFWGRQVGLTCAEMLPVGSGVQQHRHLVGKSVLKINHSRQPLGDAGPGGIRAITLGSRTATPVGRQAQSLQDPDGNVVWLRPTNGGAIDKLIVHLTVSNLQRHLDFYGETMGLPELRACTFGCGASEIQLREGDVTLNPEQRGPGYRYLTVQVFDVRKTHRAILDRGGREGMAPVKLGDIAHIAFVRDPDGNWIEISQRKSLTGSLD